MIVFIHNAFISKVSGPHLLTVCAAENRVHGNSHASLAFINLEISVQSSQISRQTSYPSFINSTCGRKLPSVRPFTLEAPRLSI